MILSGDKNITDFGVCQMSHNWKHQMIHTVINHKTRKQSWLLNLLKKMKWHLFTINLPQGLKSHWSHSAIFLKIQCIIWYHFAWAQIIIWRVCWFFFFLFSNNINEILNTIFSSMCKQVRGHKSHSEKRCLKITGRKLSHLFAFILTQIDI